MSTPEPLPAITQKKYTPEHAWEVGLPSVEAIQILKTTAGTLVDTPFLPRSLQKDGIDRQATLLAVMLTGREMRMAPMESVRSFYLAPGGQLGMYYTGMLAVMLRNGFRIDWKVSTDTECEALFTRTDGQSFLSTFTIEQAKRAGLVKPDSNWLKWPENMLRARVTGNAWRLLAGDLAGGATLYAKEELDDITEPEPPTEFKVGRTAEATPVVTVDVKPEPETPAPEPTLAEKTRARMDAIELKISTAYPKLLPASVRAKVNMFLREFLGVKVLPKTTEPFLPALDRLEEIAADPALWAAFLADPTKAARHTGLDAMFTEWGWGPMTQSAAKQVINKRGMTADQFVSWVEGPLKLNVRSEADAFSFFQLANVTQDAYRALNLADRLVVPVSEVVTMVEQQIDPAMLADATEEQVALAFETLEGAGTAEPGLFTEEGS